MSRGNGGIPIFRDDADWVLFLKLLAEEGERSRWILHDDCLMTTHDHLAIETPQCTLSTGMHRLLGRYASGPGMLNDALPLTPSLSPKLIPGSSSNAVPGRGGWSYSEPETVRRGHRSDVVAEGELRRLPYQAFDLREIAR